MQIDKCSFALVAIRILLGFILAVHGYKKVVGGMEGWVKYITSLDVPLLNTKFPVWMAKLAAWVEFLGGIALMLGIATRPVAIVMTIFLIFAMYLAHWDKGFFVNQGGYEFALTLMVLSVVLSISGGGNSLELYRL